MAKIINRVAVPQFMTITEASEYFGVSKYFLRKGIREGSIAHTLLGNKYKIDVEALQRQMDYSVKACTGERKRG